MLKTVENCFRR